VREVELAGVEADVAESCRDYYERLYEMRMVCSS
jgi:hypothetical protein